MRKQALGCNNLAGHLLWRDRITVYFDSETFNKHFSGWTESLTDPRVQGRNFYWRVYEGEFYLFYLDKLDDINNAK